MASGVYDVKTVYVIWHSMTGGSKALALAAADAAMAAVEDCAKDMPDDKDRLQILITHCDDMTAEMMLDAYGYLFVFPENLAAISGVMKSFFDRCYYPCLGRIEGRPYAMIVCAGSDGSNAVRQAERIATGWRLKKIIDSRIVCTYAQTAEAILAPKCIDQSGLAIAAEAGATLAAGIAMDVF